VVAVSLNELKETIASFSLSERIVFVGGSLVPHLWVQASDLFASGSEFEGMPLAALEAVGAGIPALLSDIEGHRIFKNLDQGLVGFFTIQNPKGGGDWICKQLEKMTNNENQYFQDRWKESTGVRSRFGISKMVARYSELYTRV
jgi:glycosyltransferase involved in cell wall biosynthesis